MQCRTFMFDQMMTRLVSVGCGVLGGELLTSISHVPTVRFSYFVKLSGKASWSFFDVQYPFQCVDALDCWNRKWIRMPLNTCTNNPRCEKSMPMLAILATLLKTLNSEKQNKLDCAQCFIWGCCLCTVWTSAEIFDTVYSNHRSLPPYTDRNGIYSRQTRYCVTAQYVSPGIDHGEIEQFMAAQGRVTSLQKPGGHALSLRGTSMGVLSMFSYSPITDRLH